MTPQLGLGRISISISILTLLLLAACQSQAAPALSPTLTESPSPTILPTSTITPTLVPSPSATATPAPTLFPLPSPDPNTALIPCDKRRPAADDLFTEVSAAYGLDPNYVPPDLVRLGDYVPGWVTLPEMLLRQAAAQALGKLVKAMLAEGLAPTVLSSYRSYFDQAVAHQRWLVEDPANADEVSALPGHSEHQLGTTVDFGSPEMPALTGSTTDKFSPLFATTHEGMWLDQHAFEYGFSMTSPQGAEMLTGLAFEPWHYRYVGVDMATYLHVRGYYLTEYLLKVRPVMPCQP
jgi:zinc D-Ala-D-Ala carboxypeptidase